MKKYFLATNKLFQYNGVRGIDYSDSIDLFNSFEECMKEACDNLLVLVNSIDELMSIKEYITSDFLSKPEINFKMSDTIVTCIITKNENELVIEILQRLRAENQTYEISLKYQFKVMEIEEKNIGYILIGRFDSDSCGYNERLSDEIYNSIFDVFEASDKINAVGMKNLSDCIIAIVDKEFASKHNIDKYEKEKRNILY